MSLNRLQNKVAVVIGATSGIGKEIVSRFSEEGAKVMMAGIVDCDGNKISKEMCEKGYEIEYIHADATSEEDMSRLMDRAIKRYGKIDVSISTVGGNSGYLLKNLPFEKFKSLIALNLFSAFLNIQYASEKMRGKNGGVIINISSMNSTVANDYQGAYCTAKAGVDMLSKVAALEMGPEHIRVCTINPGIIATPLTEKFRKSPEILEEYMSHVPLRRVGQVKDVANLAVFLASDEASYITASSHYVDGGAAPEGYSEAFKMVMGTYSRPVAYEEEE